MQPDFGIFSTDAISLYGRFPYIIHATVVRRENSIDIIIERMLKS